MKKKLISVLALVLVVCFVCVAEVDAVDSVSSFSVYEVGLICSGARNMVYSQSFDWFSCPILIDDVLYSYFYIKDQAFYFSYFINIFPVSTNVNFKLVYFPFVSDRLSNLDSSKFVSWTQSGVTVETLVLNSLAFDSCTLIKDGSYLVSNCAIYDLSYTSSKQFSYFGFDLNSRSGLSVGYLGFLCELDVNGLSDEDKSLLEQIKIGVDSANLQLDQMQSEQSSYYEDILQSEASDTDVIAEASSQKDKFDGVMSEYSSLNEALDRPDVNELLPDYSSVVGGYKDDEFYDVFDVFYGNGYIMFMLLASVFFATMSFVIFGKKA